MAILDELEARANYAMAQHEPLYVSQDEVDKLRTLVGIDITKTGTVYQIDAAKALAQAEAAAP